MYFQRRLTTAIASGNTDGMHIQNPEGTDIEAFVLPPNAKGQVEAAALVGKRDNPDFHYLFRSLSQFQQSLAELVASRKSYVQHKREQLQKRKNFQHTYKEGDILYSSWGYDQTNVNFYQVVGVSGKQITLREILDRTVRSEQGDEYVAAIPGMFRGGPPITRIPNMYGGVRINDVQSARLWDGKPQYETSAGYGH